MFFNYLWISNLFNKSVKIKNKRELLKEIVKYGTYEEVSKKIYSTELTNRIAFTLIFGEKVRLAKDGKKSAIEVVAAGTTEEPCKIKKTNKAAKIKDDIITNTVSYLYYTIKK